MNVDWDEVKRVAERYREQILSLPGVVGVSTGVLRESGEAQPCIRVYLSSPAERGEFKDQRVPLQLEGVPVDVVVTGKIVAFDEHS